MQFKTCIDHYSNADFYYNACPDKKEMKWYWNVQYIFVDEEAILRLLHLSKNKESRYRCSRVLSHKDKPEEIVSANKRYFDNEAALDLRF